MKRRDFLKQAVWSGAVVATPGLGRVFADSTTQPAGRLPTRPYGRDGVKLSIIGFPGFALKDVTPEDADRVISASVERGMNYFDVAPSYGNAEERMGPALERHRKHVFLACKTGKRDAAGAREELNGSLERLRTDHFDLYQLHHITDVERDVEAAFAKGGAMEPILEARQAGVIRYLGFSAHSIAAALRAMELFEFDSALVPINYRCIKAGNFGQQIIDAATKKDVTLMALKGMARQTWPDGPEGKAGKEKYPRCWYQPISDRREAALSLRYTLSRPIAAAIPPADVSLLPLAIDIASKFKPMQPDEEQTLAAMSADWKPVFRHG